MQTKDTKHPTSVSSTLLYLFPPRTVLWNSRTAVGYLATRILPKLCQRDRQTIPYMMKVALLIVIISQSCLCLTVFRGMLVVTVRIHQL